MENIQAVISQQAGKITCNFEQVEAALNERMHEFDGAVFTEESKALAKKIVAGLRSEQKKFAENLKEEKKKYMAPWDSFEARAKVLIAKYDEPVNSINGQVKEMEEKRVAEKRGIIQQIYKETAAEMEQFIPLSKIYDKKWENAGTREKNIREDMITIAASTRQAVDTICGMHSSAEKEALNIYKNNLSLTEAIAYINNYERQKQEILVAEQERRHQEEMDRIRLEEMRRIAAEQQAQAEKEAALQRAEEEKAAAVETAREKAAAEVVEGLIPEFEGETNLYEYRFALTSDAKEKLEMYLDSVGIDWEMI